jgi:hypothetical protein
MNLRHANESYGVSRELENDARHSINVHTSSLTIRDKSYRLDDRMLTLLHELCLMMLFPYSYVSLCRMSVCPEDEPSAETMTMKNERRCAM